MPTPPLLRAVRAPRRAHLRRLLHLLALTAVALPLVALAPAPAGVPGVAVADEPPVAPTPQVVTVIDGLTVRFAVTTASTVADVLRELEVERTPLDRVEPGLTARIDGPTVIGLTRVALVEERVEVPLPRAVVRVEDPDLLRGYVRVERAGREGLRIDTQLVMKVAGEVESRLTVVSHTLRAPRERVERIGTGTRPGDTVWDALARCEAGGRWDAVRTVDGRVLFSGGLQFAPRTWAAFKSEGLPEQASDATREQQIEVAERVLARQGWEAWPTCSRRLGLR
jgi:resuscitation-promoting factor RpfB